MPQDIKLAKKEGSGVGANIKFYNAGDKYIGNLTFHEKQDWQVTDSSQADKFDWDEYFIPALNLARQRYPNG